ncbi:MAG: 50S ribosomal protein L25 [Myxococcota bacterium]
MGDVTFAVEARTDRGKGAARKLRARGMAPGVVYGGGREATAISFDVKGLDRLIATSHGGLNTLIDLSGDSDASGRTVIAKDLQREPVRGGITHADFYEINLSQKIEVSVPINLTGTPAGVVLGGVLDQQQREIVLMCLPNAIPDEVEVDVSGLELGDSLHIEQIPVPDGTEVTTEGILTVATVLVPRGLKDGEGEASGEEGEGTEGEAAEGGDDAKAEGGDS